MTNHQAFRKFCHFLRKTGYYKEYWRLVYKAGLSKNFIKKEVDPLYYISHVDAASNGIITHIELQEKQIAWRKELNQSKKCKVSTARRVLSNEDIMALLRMYQSTIY